MQERRRSARYPLSCIVAFSDPALGAVPVADLSCQGCKLLSRGIYLSVGQLISFDISVEVETIHVDSAVVRWTTAYHAGIEFLVMSAKEQARLGAFLVTASHLLIPER